MRTNADTVRVNLIQDIRSFVNEIIKYLINIELSYKTVCCVRLLGEPCDPAILIQHYGKLSSSVHTEAGMDFKSESAAIYVLVSHDYVLPCLRNSFESSRSCSGVQNLSKFDDLKSISLMFQILAKDFPSKV